MGRSTRQDALHDSAASRTEAKRARIVETAMRYFAEQGYHEARVRISPPTGYREGLGVPHFGSKERLFLAATSARSSLFRLARRAPDVRVQGFFATMRYWLERTERLMREDWIPLPRGAHGQHGRISRSDA
jgi:AcrR family transcriptional regulator